MHTLPSSPLGPHRAHSCAGSVGPQSQEAIVPSPCLFAFGLDFLLDILCLYLRGLAAYPFFKISGTYCQGYVKSSPDGTKDFLSGAQLYLELLSRMSPYRMQKYHCFHKCLMSSCVSWGPLYPGYSNE